MTLALILQITAAIFGMAGAWLLRKPGRRAPWAFVLWLVSNPAAVALSVLQGNWWLAAMFTLYFWLAVESTFNWLVRPLLSELPELAE